MLRDLCLDLTNIAKYVPVHLGKVMNVYVLQFLVEFASKNALMSKFGKRDMKSTDAREKVNKPQLLPPYSFA